MIKKLNIHLFCFLLGVIGPILVNEIEKYIHATNRKNDVNCLKISHIGTYIHNL